MADNWTPPSDAEVVDWTPPSDAQTTDEPVKKKVVTTPSESTSQDGAKVLSDVSEQFRKAGTQGEKPLSESGIKNEILKVVPQKDITDETTLDARGNKRNTRNLTYKLIPLEDEQKAIQVDESKKPTTLQDAYKSKISDIYKLAEEHKSLSSDYAKNYTIAEVASLDPNVVRLNNLMLQRDNAMQNNEGQKVADLSSEIESLKNAPVDTPTDIQQIVAQSNAQNQGAPQDTPDFRSGFKPKTINEKLKSIGVTPVKTVGELADVRSIAQNMMGDLKKPIESAKYDLDEYKERDNIGVEGLDENGVKVREGIKGAIPAFIDGFVNTSKSMLQGIEFLDATLKGDDTKKIELAKQRWVEENILHPVENKGAIANASNMLGGVAPYAMGGAVLGEAEIVPRMIMDATGMGLSDVGNGYYEGFAKMKDEGKSDEVANDYATKKMAYEGATGAMLGAGLPHISNGSSKIFGVAKDENTVRKFLADGFGMTTAFTGRKLLGNAYEKYGLGNENVKLSEGLQETAEGVLMLHGLMHVLPKAPKAIKDIYDVTIARQFPNIEKRFARGVEKGEITQQQADAITVPLEKKFAIYNAMPEGLTAEQMVSIKPETEQILELSKKEPSAVENPEVTKDKIVQLQKQVAEKLGTPLTEKEMKSYEKLQEIKGDKEDKLTPSEKLELNHYEKRIKTAEDIEAKLAEEKKVAEAEIPTTNVGVEEGSVGVGGDAPLKENEYYHATDNNEILAPSDKGYKKREGNNVVGEGIYFGKDKEHLTDRYGENIIKVELDIKNPLVSDNKYIVVDGREIDVQSLSKDDINFLKEKGYDAIKYVAADKAYSKFNETIVFDKSQIKKSEQSLKETPKAEPIVAEKPVVENKEVPKVELPKEVINKFKSLNEPQNEGKNGGTDGINTGKSKDGESGNVGKAKTKKADTSSKDSNAEGNEGGEKTKGLKGKGNRIVAKIKGALKHPDYIRALAHEVTDVKDIVLQAFIGGQKINPSYIKELFANSQREWNVRIGLMDGKAPSIKELAHDMWEAHKMNFGEETKVSDQDYVNAIEAVIREHNGKKTMVDDINNRFISEDKIDEEHQKWNEYHRNHEQEVVDESAKILEGIDNEELGNKIANAKDDAEVEKYISEIELKAKQKVDEAIEKYKNEKGEIDSDAVDAIEKEYGKSVAEEVKQSDKFFPFQVEEPTSKRQEMVKDAVQSLIDNGFTKLEQIHQIAKEQLGEGYKKQEIDDAFNAIGKDKVSKEAEPITKGVIGRVSQWLNKTFGGKENVQILGSTKAIMDKAKSLMGGNSNGQPLFMHTPDGKVLGFTHDNKIYLNQEHLNPNTPVHEAGHIWTNWAKENQADHYEKGMDLVNGTDYLAKAKASEFYQKEALKLGKEGSKEYEDYMKHEALAMAIGDKGSKFVTEATRKSFTEWAKELWDSVAKAVGLKDTSAQELQNLTFDELTSRIAKDILSEAPSNYGTSRTIINENRAKLGLGEIGKGKGRTNQETRTVASEIYNQEQANELVDEVLSPDYNKFERTLSANELLVLEEHLRLQELSIKQNDKDRLSIKEKLAKEPDNTEYMGSLAVLESNRQMDIDNKIRTEYAITNAKTATAISLQERGIVTNEHGVLKQLVNGIKDAWGKDIPEWAKEKISDLEKLHSEAVAKIELLNDKYIRGKAEKEIETIKKGAKGKATKEQILERSKQRLAEMIANRNKVEFSVEGDIEKTLDKELFKAIIPDIRELINSKLAEGKLTTLDEISESVANDYKDVIDGVKASDIIDVLGGVYSEKRTKSTLQKQAAELRKQAGEARRLENAQKGIFEKGQPQGEKSETSKEIARLKSIHDAKAKLEDLEKGIIRKTKERGASDPEVVALQKQAAELRKQVINNSPELSSEQLFKKALAIERQIKEGNFNKSVEERKKFESNEDWIKANRSLANARNQLNELKRDALNSNKTKIMKLEDWVTRFGRNMIFIGNFATFAKLAFASSQGFVLRPIQESVIGKITKKAFPFLADKAPVEGTLENDYKQFYGDFLSPRQLWATIRDVSKSSTTELSKKNDPYVDESINMADFLSDDIKAKYPNAERVLRTTSHIGNRIIDMSSAGWHQIVKDPIKRATYNASFGNIMKYYADHNLNYNDPMLIEQAEQIAWIRAKQEIFLEGNAWGGSLKEYAQKQKKIALEMVRLGKENPALKKEWKANWEYTKGAIADVLVPIATVPANIARRSAMANPVSLVSSIAEAKKMNNIIKESLGEVTNEEADAIILKIKQRSIGSALFILGGLAGAGWLGKKYSAGGLYSPFYPDWKRDKDEPVSNELNIAGEEVPHSMQHITLFTTYQMAATFGVMFNHFYEKEMKDNSNRAEYLNILMAVLDAGLATGGAIAGTVPTYGKVQSVAAGFATGKMDKVFRDTKKQFGVQKISGALDYTGILNYSKDELDAQELEKKRNKEKEDSSKERHDNMRKAN